MGENGAHVTHRELRAFERLMDAKLEPLKEGLGRVEGKIDAMAARSWLGPRGHDLLAGGSILTAAVAIMLAVLFH